METEDLLEPRSMSKSYESQQPQAADRTSEDVIREWVARFATNCGQSLSDARVLLWIDELQDIEPQRLEPAFRAVMRAHTFNSIPQIGEIRALIAQADAGGLQLEAEDAWQKYLTHVQKFFHPDIGWDRRTPHLSAIVEHAARAAGGAHWVESCPESELQWCRKRFVEAFLLVHETGQVEHLLTSGEARKILMRLMTNSPPQTKSLPSRPVPSLSTETSSGPEDSAGAAFAEARAQINAPRAMPEPPTKEELERHKREQLTRFNSYLREHPELASQQEQRA